MSSSMSGLMRALSTAVNLAREAAGGSADAASAAAGAAVDIASSISRSARRGVTDEQFLRSGGDAASSVAASAAGVVNHIQIRAMGAMQGIATTWTGASYRETPLIAEARLLLHEVSKDISGNPQQLQNQLDGIANKLDHLAKELIGKSNQEEAVAKLGPLHEPFQNGRIYRGTFGRSDHFRQIHDFCLLVMKNELPSVMQSALIDLTNAVTDSGTDSGDCKEIAAIMSRINGIYQGSILDLPLLGYPWESIQRTVKEYCIENRKVDFSGTSSRSYIAFERILEETTLSQHDKETLILSVLRLTSFTPDSSKMRSVVAPLIRKALEGGAYFPDVSQFKHELILYFDPLLKKDDALELEKLVLSGYDISGSQFFEMIKDGFKASLKRLKLYECAVDYGADPRAMIGEEKIAKIRESIKAGKKKFMKEFRTSTYGTGYILPDGVKEWEFRLIQRWDLGIYNQAFDLVKAKKAKAKIQETDVQSLLTAGAAAVMVVPGMAAAGMAAAGAEAGVEGTEGERRRAMGAADKKAGNGLDDDTFVILAPDSGEEGVKEAGERRGSSLASGRKMSPRELAMSENCPLPAELIGIINEFDDVSQKEIVREVSLLCISQENRKMDKYDVIYAAQVLK